MSSKVGAAFFQLADFALTGVTSRDPKAVKTIDDQGETMMCCLQYVLPHFWARLALAIPMYPPPFSRTRYMDIPVYSSDYSGIIL